MLVGKNMEELGNAELAEQQRFEVQANRVMVTGPGVQLHGVIQGAKTYFLIKLEDAANGIEGCPMLGDKSNGLGSFKVYIRDSSGAEDSVKTSIRAIDAESLLCEWTASNVGLHVVQVYYKGKHVQRSPFGVKVSPAITVQFVDHQELRPMNATPIEYDNKSNHGNKATTPTPAASTEPSGPGDDYVVSFFTDGSVEASVITSVTHKNTAKTSSEIPAEANAAVKSKGVLFNDLSKKSAATDTNMQITKNDAAGSEEDMISPPRKSKNEPKANQSKAQRNKANIPKKMGPKMAKMNKFPRENFDAENCTVPSEQTRLKLDD